MPSAFYVSFYPVSWVHSSRSLQLTVHMAKSFLEECQAWLKHQLSDYLGEKWPPLPSSFIKTLEFIPQRAHWELTDLLQPFLYPHGESVRKTSWLACASSAQALLESLGLVGNRWAWLFWWAEVSEKPGEQPRAWLCQLRPVTEPPRASKSSSWKGTWEKKVAHHRKLLFISWESGAEIVVYLTLLTNVHHYYFIKAVVRAGILVSLQNLPPPVNVFLAVPEFLWTEKPSFCCCSLLVYTFWKHKHLPEGIIHQSNPDQNTQGFSNVFFLSGGIRYLLMDNRDRDY